MIETTRVRNRGARILLVTASLVVVIAGLRAAVSFLLPLLVAVILSILSWPLVAGLTRRRFPHWLAVIVAVLTNIAAVAVIVSLVSGSLNDFTRSLPRYQAALERQATAAVVWLEAHGFDTSDLAWLNDADEPEEGDGENGENGVEESSSARKSPFNTSSLIDLFVGTLRGLALFLSNAAAVLLMMIFILSEARTLPAKLERAFAWDETNVARLVRAKDEIHKYLGIKTLISAVTGLVAGVLVWILGVDYPALWGLLAFLLNYIPSLGSIIAAVPPTLLTLVDIGVGRALMVAVGYLAINMVLGNFVEPHLMGRRFGLSTFVVFLSLVFWYWLWGPVGALLSVPLTMIIKILFEHTHDLRWIATLLGSGKPRSNAA